MTLALTFFMAYVGLMVGAAKGDYLELSALGGILTDKASRRDLKILDTSAIIDGRIADVAETGFLTGSLIIPQLFFVSCNRWLTLRILRNANAAGADSICSTGCRITARWISKLSRLIFLQCAKLI
jgi:hypothetical protein